MLFSHFIATVKATKNHFNAQSKFFNDASLITPHVGANGRDENFEFENEIIVKTKSRRDFTQLGFNAIDSFGMVRTKKSFAPKNIELFIDFSLNYDGIRGGKESGFGLWLTDNFSNEKQFYGRNKSFKGCGVVVDLENTPHVAFINDKNIKSKGIPLKNLEDNYRVAIRQYKKLFRLSLYHKENESVLYEGELNMPSSVFLSATSYSGLSASSFKLERILANEYIKSKVPVQTVRGARHGTSKIIIICGICTIVGLIYYLVTRNSAVKSIDFKK